MISRKKEHGVALLFALGLLSLMSVLGVAFVANSLTAQKTAANLGSRNHAQILLNSAIERVMINLMTVFRLDKALTDIDLIYSMNSAENRPTSGAVNNKYDQLNDPQISKMNVPKNIVPGQNAYDGSKSKSTWVYLYDNDNKIIGRMAYQVLPNYSSNISLDQVLKGIYDPITKKIDDSGSKWEQRIGRDIGELAIGKTSAFVSEWKKGTTGLYQNLPATTDTPIVSSFNEFWATNYYPIIGDPADSVTEPIRKNWLKYWFSDTTSDEEVFHQANESKKGLSDLDGNKDSFHRFNVGSLKSVVYDRWYDRFQNYTNTANDPTGEEARKSMRNSEKIVLNILNPSQAYVHGSVSTPKESGLQYLRTIAKDRGGFGAFENLRKQIAANLNDYCDSDSIPTSDIPAKDWDAADDKKIPSYTGNEKTPYINEFALGLKTNITEEKLPSKNTLKGTELTNITSKITLDKVDPAFFVELIKIYDEFNFFKDGNIAYLDYNSAGGAKTTKIDSAYKLNMWYSKIAFSATAAFSGKIKITYKKSDEETVTVCENVAFTSTQSHADVQTFDSTAGAAASLSTASKLFPAAEDAALFEGKSYHVETLPLNPLSVNREITLKVGEAAESQANDAIQKAKDENKIPGETDAAKFTYEIELTDVTVKIGDVLLGVRAAGLYAKDDDGYHGIDFVSVPKKDDGTGTYQVQEISSPTGEFVNLKFSLQDDGGVKKWIAADAPKDFDFVYLSGLEVRDPRQNLNCNKFTVGSSFAVDTSDWRCAPKLQAKLDSATVDAAMRIGSMDFTNFDPTKYTSIKGTDILGLVNSCSNPQAPFSTTDPYNSSGKGEPAVDYDFETVQDPAWYGNLADKKHMSTAFIRNKPMLSLWELGAIHRGSAWKTINLKRAAVDDSGTIRRLDLKDNTTETDLIGAGQSYKYGDGLILDQVKLTPDVLSDTGKLDVNMLHRASAFDSVSKQNEWNKDIVRALFANIRYGQSIGDLYETYDAATPKAIPETGTKIEWNSIPDSVINDVRTAPAGRDNDDPNKELYISRSDFVEGVNAPSSSTSLSLADGFGLIPNWNSQPDAQQEEMIGKTVNLLSAGSKPPETIQVVIIVQTIKSVPDGVTIVRQMYDKDNPDTLITKQITSTADFDMEPLSDGRNVYYDEITGEIRALVSIKKIADANGIRLKLYNVQYY